MEGTSKSRETTARKTINLNKDIPTLKRKCKLRTLDEAKLGASKSRETTAGKKISLKKDIPEKQL